MLVDGFENVVEFGVQFEIVLLDRGLKIVEIYQVVFQVFFEKEELYCDFDLSCDKVVVVLGISLGYLFQVICEVFGSSFIIYVNVLCIVVVKQMLEDEVYIFYSLLVIGEEVGFRLKFVFYIIFKKYIGMILSVY